MPPKIHLGLKLVNKLCRSKAIRLHVVDKVITTMEIRPLGDPT